MKIWKDHWEIFSHFQADLGEGPVWDDLKDLFYWLDIVKGNIHYYSPFTGQSKTISLGQKIGCLSLTTDSNKLILGLKNGLHFLSLENNLLKLLIHPESTQPNNRFNDGKTDPLGNFCAGTMDEVLNTKGIAKLYQYKPDHTLEILQDEISCSNGLTWDMERHLFYLIDTGTRSLFCYDFLKEGSIDNKRLLFTFKDENGIPDGMTIDTEGKLWIALWNGSKVIRLDPESLQVLLEIELPVKKVTSCCFGGKDLNDLYITTAKIGLNEKEMLEQPLAGSTFLIKNTNFHGFKTNRFKIL